MSRQASDKVLVYLALLLCPVLSDHLNEPDLCAEEPADSNCYCGAPAEPEGVDIYYALNDTRYDHNHSDHNIHKSRIVYKCHNRYDLLVGNDMRKCHRGKWLGQVPRCGMHARFHLMIVIVEVRTNDYSLLYCVFIWCLFNNGRFNFPLFFAIL